MSAWSRRGRFVPQVATPAEVASLCLVVLATCVNRDRGNAKPGCWLCATNQALMCILYDLARRILRESVHRLDGKIFTRRQWLRLRPSSGRLYSGGLIVPQGYGLVTSYMVGGFDIGDNSRRKHRSGGCWGARFFHGATPPSSSRAISLHLQHTLGRVHKQVFSE